MSKKQVVGEISLFVVAAAAIVICAVAVLMMPVNASGEASDASYSATSDYLPAQIANQAKEIEPEPVMYY